MRFSVRTLRAVGSMKADASRPRLDARGATLKETTMPRYDESARDALAAAISSAMVA